MKAAFVFTVIVAIIGIVMAGVHHYRIDKDGNRVEVGAVDTVHYVQTESHHHSEDIFDIAANGIKAVGGALHNVASDILG